MSEEKIVKRIIGAKLVKNSGRNTLKGDFIWREFVGDIKEGASLQLNESVWGKICSDADTHGWHKAPMILRVLPNGERIACVEFKWLENTLNRLEELEDWHERRSNK